jgi:UTP:GlnB (protein PII) uridylyltransferase
MGSRSKIIKPAGSGRWTRPATALSQIPKLRIAGIDAAAFGDTVLVSPGYYLESLHMKNGVVLLIFQCRVPEGLTQKPDWKAIRQDMKRSLEGKLALDYRIAAHTAQRGYLRSVVRRSPSRAVVDNESSGSYTILEVYSTDRVGLLYTITRTLLDLHVRIYVAKITTRIDQVADVFYILTDDGQKVTDPDQIKEIQDALAFWLDTVQAGSTDG